MDSALVVVGLAVVLAVQIAIHLRIAGIPKQVAILKLVTEGRARPENDVFQEALARRLNLVVRGIQAYHDQIADDFRIQVAAGETRARLAEGKTADAAPIVAELRALAREMATLTAELRALQGDLAELVVAVAEARCAPAAAPVTPKAAPALEDPDERKTIEMPPPPPAAPPAASAPASDGDDDEGWDDPEEKTKLFSKDAGPAVLRQRAGAPTLRVSRNALRPPPPPIADEDDGAMERPSILPEARR